VRLHFLAVEGEQFGGELSLSGHCLHCLSVVVRRKYIVCGIYLSSSTSVLLSASPFDSYCTGLEADKWRS